MPFPLISAAPLIPFLVVLAYIVPTGPSVSVQVTVEKDGSETGVTVPSEPIRNRAESQLSQTEPSEAATGQNRPSVMSAQAAGIWGTARSRPRKACT